MIKDLNKPLAIENIEFRIQSINAGGFATILAYKDSRVDMNILDEVVGPLNWKREHTRDNKNCIVSIWDEEKKQWISKEDTGTESNTEKEKGLASDSFKRACFNWGIGRELYDYPLIQIKLKQNEKKDIYGERYLKDGRPTQGYGLKLKEWKWGSEFKDGKLVAIACKDSSGEVRFKRGEFSSKTTQGN